MQGREPVQSVGTAAVFRYVPTGEPVSAGRSTHSRRTRSARHCVAGGRYGTGCRRRRHPARRCETRAKRAPRDANGVLAMRTASSQVKRARARQRRSAGSTVSREPCEDTTGRPAAVAHGSNDAARSDDSAENRSFPACSRNAARSDDTAGLRPASGRNPQDSGNVTSGEETTIPIPRSDGGVEELLDRFDAGREAVREADIEALEAETDRAVTTRSSRLTRSWRSWRSIST